MKNYSMKNYSPCDKKLTLSSDISLMKYALRPQETSKINVNAMSRAWKNELAANKEYVLIMFMPLTILL